MTYDMKNPNERTDMPRTITLTDGQLVSFAGMRYDRFNKIGIAWDGGRKEHGGPVFDEAFPFTYRLAAVIDNNGGTANEMREAQQTVLERGDYVRFEGLESTYIVAGSDFAGVKFVEVD